MRREAKMDATGDGFTVLAESGVLDPARLESLRALALFRNRLVHPDRDVDDARIHDYLRGHLGDLERCRSEHLLPEVVRPVYRVGHAMSVIAR